MHGDCDDDVDRPSVYTNLDGGDRQNQRKRSLQDVRIFESGNLIRKAKALCRYWCRFYIGIPACERSCDGDGGAVTEGEHRTKMKPLHYEKRDYMAYLVVLCYLAAGVVLGKLLPI